ncbi:helix-turn-helix domain-containing protein [Paenibacillus dakarensis]|uniref:helix-turn-helix domain-containing protein n=1 Tax=Paenibacillus dakarensis TaxID=1527293 RepID=UPI0006D54C2E|nr:helix-turn-helix domain-containing protein [Paenibacillus dakarensis]
MKEASSRQATLLLRFFVPYVLILFSSLLVGWFAYEKTSDLVESETMKSSQAVLGQIREALDRRLAEIETIVRQMSSEPKLASFQFVKDPFGGKNPYGLWDLEKSLFDYRMFNHFIVDYYVAFRNSEMFVSPRKVYTMNQFYDMQLHYEDLTLEEWRSQLFNTYHYKTYLPGSEIKYEGKPYSAVSFMQSFGHKDGGGVITVLINNAQIQEMLRNIDSEQGGFAYIADENGNLISHIGLEDKGDEMKALPTTGGFSQINWNGREMLVTETTSSYNNWTYVSAQPKGVVLEKAYYIKELTLSVFLAALILGVIIAAYFAYLSSRPFFKLMQILPLSRSGKKPTILRNTVDDIRSSVSELIARHDAMKDRLEAQLPQMRGVFMDRLLKGGYTSMRDVEAAMEHSRLDLAGLHYTVVILRLRGYHAPYNEEILTEMDITKLGIRDRIGELCIQGVVHDLGENLMAVLLYGEEESPEEFTSRVKPLLEEMYSRLTGETGAGLYMAAGGCQSRLTEVYRSFSEAQFVLRHARWSECSPILYPEDVEITVPGYFYPSDVEARLIQLVKSGNQAETSRLIEQLVDHNGRASKNPMAVDRLLVFELSGTLIKCCEQAAGLDMTEEVETALKTADSALSPAEAVQMLSASFMNLCRKNDERKKSHNDDLTKRLIHYIDEHYPESDLCLSVLAQEARASEAYVSYFFKEQTGLNFSDYLENIRMREAKRLLLTSGKPVSEIAALVGYLSLNTFSRAFKRANGVSATEYRRTHEAG